MPEEMALDVAGALGCDCWVGRDSVIVVMATASAFRMSPG